jgi:hypothetical protein
MFLVDTNVWLEVLLDQERADEAREFLQGVDASQLAISEFSRYSIGLVLSRLAKDDVFADFVSDMLEDSGVARVQLALAELRGLLRLRQESGLDFDDAYQYVAAEKTGAVLVSFDSDFDRSERGRMVPGQALKATRLRGEGKPK